MAATPPQLQVVNSILEQLNRCAELVAPGDAGDLGSRLAEIDPAATTAPGSWWQQALTR